MPKTNNTIVNEKDNTLFKEVQNQINNGPNNNYGSGPMFNNVTPTFTAPPSEMSKNMWSMPSPSFTAPTMGPGFGGPIKPESKFTKDNEYANCIKSNEYKLSEMESTIAKWHFRHNNGSVAIEITDAANEIVKAKFTDEEWQFKSEFTHEEYVNVMTTLKNTINTIKLLTNGSDVPLDVTSELGICYKILEKNLEKVYNRVVANKYKSL